MQRAFCFLRTWLLSEGGWRALELRNAPRHPPTPREHHLAYRPYHKMRILLVTTKLFLGFFPVFACMPLSAGAQCQWYVQRVPDFREEVPSIYFADSLHGWVGRNPLAYDCMLRTTNGGKTWDTINFSVGQQGGVSSISFIDTSQGWCMVPGLNKLLKTTDGGLTWREIYTTPYYKLNFIIQFIDSLNGFGVGADTAYGTSRVWKSIDGGKSWTSHTLPNGSLGRLDFPDLRHGWLVGQGMYATTDSGRTWQGQVYDSITVGGLCGAVFIDSLRGWACAQSSGWVIHTSDGGKTWVNEFHIPQSPHQLTPSNISFSDSLNGWIFGFTFYLGDLSELIYRTTDGGKSWFQESIGLSRQLWAGIAIDPCHVWAISSGDGSILTLGSTVVEPTLTLPESIELSQNYPNPFNPATRISVQLPHREHVVLKVSDELGREIAVLVDETYEAGTHIVLFNATTLPSGIYYIHLLTITSHQVKKAVLVK